MPRPPTIVVDIDGVLATGTPEEVYSNKAGWAYEKCSPKQQTIEVLKRVVEKTRVLGNNRVRIVLFTARWEQDREKTVKWLSDHDVPYDILHMGKPPADLYLDDKNYPISFEGPDTTVEAEADRILEALCENRNSIHADWTFEESS